MSCFARHACAAALLALALLSSAVQAEAPVAPLEVVAADCPPFVMSEGGKLGGLGIFLWDQVAREMGVQYTITEVALGDMLQALSTPRDKRTVNVGISCISITAERERYVDFSHSFYETYTGIAVKEKGIMASFMAIMTSPAALHGLAIFLGVAALVGAVFFLLERGSNSKLYTMDSRLGRLVEALLVGSVFITRGPINFWEFKSLTARAMATVLAIGATFLIAGMTAVLASAFTLNSLRSQVTGLHDLAHMRVGALESSTTSSFLRKNGIPHQTRKELLALVEELDNGYLDAVVSDAAVLKYTLKIGKENGKYGTLSVLPYEFDKQNYGFALETRSDLVEEVNLALLKVRKSEVWKKQVLAYLGQ